MKDAVYTDLSIGDYHGNQTHISATQVKIAKRSLKEFHWYRTGQIKQEQKSFFDFGNAFELALMDRDLFANGVMVMEDEKWVKAAMEKNPDLKTPRNSGTYQELKKAFEATANGYYKIMDTGKESYETIKHMVESCYRDAVIKKLITNTEYQVSCFWTDEQTGLRLKCRPDICKSKKNVIVNIKTALDGSPKAFSQDLAKLDYPLQACMEMTGCLRSGLMESVDNYFWLVVEKEPPFNATLYEFDESDIRSSMDELDYVLRKIKRAQDENMFPGYSDRADNQYGILKAEIPMWYRLAGM